MVYARFATGFKSGGFNGRANSVAERTQYEPEEVNSYEIGIRSTIAGQLRLNVTAFYNDYRNFQARVSGTGLDPVTSQRIFEMLRDKADRLLCRRRPVRVLRLGDRLERGDQAAAKDVGKPNELHDDRVRWRLSRRGLGGGSDRHQRKRERDHERTDHASLWRSVLAPATQSPSS